MVKLSAATTSQVYLPSTAENPDPSERAWVKVKSKLVVSDIIAIASGDQGMPDTEKLITGLASFITDWNYTEDDGVTPLPITKENINKLEIVDFTMLGNLFGDLAKNAQEAMDTDEKKTSTDTSTESTVSTTQE